MITYEITAVVQPGLDDDYECYMRERHIPDLLRTGCFVAASISRAQEGRYRIRYEAPDRATLDRYLREHASHLRAHFMETFPAGVEVTREEWDVLESWST